MPLDFKYKPVYLEPNVARRLHCPIITTEESLGNPNKSPTQQKPNIPTKDLSIKSTGNSRATVSTAHNQTLATVIHSDAKLTECTKPGQPKEITPTQQQTQQLQLTKAHIVTTNTLKKKPLADLTNKAHPKDTSLAISVTTIHSPKQKAGNFPCPHCSNIYVHRPSLSKHLSKHHQGVQLDGGSIKCSKCSFRYGIHTIWIYLGCT